MFDVKTIKGKLEFIAETYTDEMHEDRPYGFCLNPCISLKEIKLFEHTHNILLPEDFCDFLLTVGNGGALGVYPLNLCSYGLNKEFPHKASWNLMLPKNFEDKEQRELFDAIYFKEEYMAGTLKIACLSWWNVTWHLVVKGYEYGKVWVDSRVDYAGIFPEINKEGNHSTFNGWFLEVLDEEVEKATLVEKS